MAIRTCFRGESKSNLIALSLAASSTGNELKQRCGASYSRAARLDDDYAYLACSMHVEVASLGQKLPLACVCFPGDWLGSNAQCGHGAKYTRAIAARHFSGVGGEALIYFRGA